MLLLLNAGVKAFRRIPRQHGHASLAQDGAGIHSVIHIMDGAAALRSSGVHSLLPGMKPREGRKKGRVDIQKSPGEVFDKRRAQNTHIARQHDHVRRVGINLMHQLAVKGFTPGELAGFQRVRGNVRFPRALKAERVGLVAENCLNGAIDFLLLAGVFFCALTD